MSIKEHRIDPLVSRISILARERRSQANPQVVGIVGGLYVDVENPIARRLLENIAIVRGTCLPDALTYGFGVRYDPWRIFAEMGINSASQEGSKTIQSLKVADITSALQKGTNDPLQEGALVAIFESSVDYTDYLRVRHPIKVKQTTVNPETVINPEVLIGPQPKARLRLSLRGLPSMFRSWGARRGRPGNEAA